jgi:hypothetical protein
MVKRPFSRILFGITVYNVHDNSKHKNSNESNAFCLFCTRINLIYYIPDLFGRSILILVLTYFISKMKNHDKIPFEPSPCYYIDFDSSLFFKGYAQWPNKYACIEAI